MRVRKPRHDEVRRALKSPNSKLIEGSTRLKRTATFAAGPREIIEVVVVKRDGTQLHAKLGSSREFATSGVRGGPFNNTDVDHGKTSRSTHTPSTTRELHHRKDQSAKRSARRSANDADAPESTEREHRRKPRKPSPKKQQKSLERLSVLKIQHCWKRFRSLREGRVALRKLRAQAIASRKSAGDNSRSKTAETAKSDVSTPLLRRSSPAKESPSPVAHPNSRAARFAEAISRNEPPPPPRRGPDRTSKSGKNSDPS